MKASDSLSGTESNYEQFLSRKSQVGLQAGFEPLWMPDFLYPFQRHLVEWAIHKGRSAINADCGLGKTPMLLTIAENVVRKTNRPVLVITPLSVVWQTIKEAEKFGVDAVRSKNGKLTSGARVVVTNYDRLGKFNPTDFSAVIADESSCIKNMDAERTGEVIEFMRTVPYRTLCTATAAPNDYIELGTSAEALGELGRQDMITRFFKQQTSKDHLGWGRTKYRLRFHAETDFWRWVVSWARLVRKPSDLGFEDGSFLLPELEMIEHIITARTRRPGCLFDLPAMTLSEEREVRKRTISERCEKVASIVSDTGQPAITWCHMNEEGNLLTQLISGAVQVSGKDTDEAKEEKFLAFVNGHIRVLVTKPVLAAWGLNFQHCAHQTFFPSHSFEQWYQAIRRCWRFGQTRKVRVDTVASEGDRGILDNMDRKAKAADLMFSRAISLTGEAMRIIRTAYGTLTQEIPSWL